MRYEYAPALVSSSTKRSLAAYCIIQRSMPCAAALSIRELLESPPGEPISIEDFEVAELGGGVVLATYLMPGRPSVNRSSIWVHRGGNWLLRFHQGTPRTD